MKSALVPVPELQTMADAFAQSGLFGQKSPAQCMALLLLAQAEGVHPAIAMRDFDVINGKPAKKAEAMHRAFLAAGGSIEWHKLDDTCADATFKHPQGGEARISWDMDRVKKAKISNEAMYAKYSRQMLRSRCISEGCRTVYPASTSGLYEPGEVKGFAEPKDMGPADVVQPEMDQQMSSADLLKHFKPLINNSKTSEELKAVVVLITPEIKARMEPAHVAELREDYMHREAQLQTA